MSIKCKGFLSIVLCFILLFVSSVSLADYFPTFEEGFQNIRGKYGPFIEALARAVDSDYEVLEREYNWEYWLDLHGLDIEKVKARETSLNRDGYPTEAVLQAVYDSLSESDNEGFHKKAKDLHALAPKPDDIAIVESEPKVEFTLREVMDDETLGALFPKHILEGYVLEDTPGIFGIDDNIVLKAVFSNDVFEDEMVIRIASKEWFNSHEQESSEANTVHYREALAGTGSSIYFEGDEHIISYSFTARDIAQIDGFLNMVNSAEQITVDSVE